MNTRGRRPGTAAGQLRRAGLRAAALLVLAASAAGAFLVSGQPGLLAGRPAGHASPASLAAATAPQATDSPLVVTKAASSASFAAAGQVVVFTFTVTNPQHNTGVARAVQVFDPRLNPLGSHLACAIGSQIQPGKSQTCTFAYTVTPADVAAGQINNPAGGCSVTGTLTGGGPAGTPVGGTCSNSVTVGQQSGAAISLANVSGPQTYATAGQTISSTYTVSNTGSEDLTDVDLTDPTASGLTCPATSLTISGAGSVMTCRAVTTVTADQIAAGQITSTATVTANANGEAVAPATATATADSVAEPDLSVQSRASVPSFATAGTDILQTYTVTNSGAAAVSGVTVSDSLHSAVTCPGGNGSLALQPGDAVVCEAVHTTTAADVAAGQVVSIATAEGTVAGGGTVLGNSATVIPVVSQPRIALFKAPTTSGISRRMAGQAVTYQYLVTDNGTAAVSGLTASDGQLGLLSCPLASLQPGQHMVCSAGHVVTAAEVASGALANSASASGRTASGAELTAADVAVLPVSPLTPSPSGILPEVPVTG